MADERDTLFSVAGDGTGADVHEPTPRAMVATSVCSEDPTGKSMKGWLWKRTPRMSDRGRSTSKLKRGLNAVYRRHHPFQKRWFEFDAATHEMSYFREIPMGDHDDISAAGVIGLSSILGWSVDGTRGERETKPSPFCFDINCVDRVYTLCAPTKEEMDRWVDTLECALSGQRDKKRRISAMRNKLKTESHTDFDKHVEALHTGNIAVQSQQVGLHQGSTAWMTGNIPSDCLSLHSSQPMESLQFFRELMKHFSPTGAGPAEAATPPTKTWSDALEASDKVRDLLATTSTCYGFFQVGDQINRCEALEDLDFVNCIIQGEVLRVRQIAGEEVSLAVLEAGDWFGASEFCACGRWMCDYVCETRVVLLRIEARLFERVFLRAEHFPLLRSSVESAVPDILHQLLVTLPLFEHSSAEATMAMARLFEVHFFGPGDILTKEGDEADTFFICVAGSAKVCIAESPDQEGGATAGGAPGAQESSEGTFLFTITAGEHFGHFGLLKNQPRAATIVAINGAIVLQTGVEGFNGMLELGGHQMRQTIEQEVGQQMFKFISQIQLFHGMDQHYDAIANVMAFQQFQPGNVVVRQGEIPEGFYAVISGTLDLVIEFVDTVATQGAAQEGRLQIDDGAGGALIVGELSENDTIGATSMMYHNVAATETVIASSATVVLFVPKRDFQELLTLSPRLKARLAQKYDKLLKEQQRQQKTIAALLRHFVATGNEARVHGSPLPPRPTT